jgi:sialic acid synthase SpsE
LRVLFFNYDFIKGAEMENTEIIIGGRLVGYNHAPLVIVEIGINHGGSLAVALDMVDAAHSSGAEIIKHQTHIIEDEMSVEAKNIIPANADKSIYDVMMQCALSKGDEVKLKEYVESLGMIFISTPFSRMAADRLDSMGVSAYKIGSGECNNYPLIKHIAAFGKPMIVSTGMNNIEQVKKTVNIIEENNTPYALLHTTNLYPTPPHLVRLGAMTELENNFPRTVIGLSDHTTNNLACYGATALGASILERHFTDKRDRSGPDIENSMDPVELSQLISGCNKIALMRGGNKTEVIEEKATSRFAFATVVSINEIKKGELFTEHNIWVKRPGTGEISADSYEKLLGRTSIRNIELDQHLSWSDVDG